MAISEELKWMIGLVQGRYQQYNLSFEQAEKICRFEQERDAPSDKHFFSQWEQWDFELVTFREVLQGEQLALYLSDHEAEIKAYEQYLINEDNSERQLKQLQYVNRIIDLHQNEFVPGLLKQEQVRMAISYMRMEGNKLTYLKEEYKKHYTSVKKEIQISYFRQNRTFRPNELKQALLHHSLNYIWPNYASFYRGADKATQAVGDFLCERAMRYFKSEQAFLAQVAKGNQARMNTLYKEFFGEMSGWHVHIEPSPEEELKSFCMGLILLDAGAEVRMNGL
ncbi:hypothetical protein GFS24_08835 [Chitinophaga sp. SYP-B3965]|uniref:hypothetical protein n=1 Tax=Chitinophaga sp. SYP-B3965 TaxID=2663120 RepID=UPI00129A057D|nr:hypothetical protein [Chitinophaga sp. SYP-B3965]MRG45218.1 hypothetical protein [Chitinophaga sp. SYP-B3965]